MWSECKTQSRLPKKLLFEELASGKRSRVGQKKRFKDILKTSLKKFNVDVDNWETLAQERDIWWSIIVDGVVTSESDRVKEVENKRQLSKYRVLTIIQPEASLRTPGGGLLKYDLGIGTCC